MYPKLQTVLQQCLDKGWKPKKFINNFTVHCGSKTILFKGFMSDLRISSYHDLFSKESGLMEFVKRKNPSHYYMGSVTSKEALEIKLMNHYCKMSQLRAEEKIQYFLDNIVIDNE